MADTYNEQYCIYDEYEYQKYIYCHYPVKASAPKCIDYEGSHYCLASAYKDNYCVYYTYENEKYIYCKEGYY